MKKTPQQRTDPLYQGASAAGISYAKMEDFLRYFARGMEWAHQEYPTVPGPADIVFGNAGEMVHSAVVDQDVPIPPTISMVTLRVQGPGGNSEHHVIAVPYSGLKELAEETQAKGFSAESRRSLGALAPKEFLFIAGVEEYYHTVQRQDPELRARFRFDEYLDGTGAALIAPGFEEHDVKPNELDAVPVLARGLEFCKKTFGRPLS